MADGKPAPPRPVVICGPSGVGEFSMVVLSRWGVIIFIFSLIRRRFHDMCVFPYLRPPTTTTTTTTISTGKGTLIELLQKHFPDNKFGFCVSHTTRKPREGEVNGVHYHFSTVESMKLEIEEGRFVEYAEVHGNYYGTR